MAKTIKEINEKEFEFKIQKQTFEENIERIAKEKTQIEKKNFEKEIEFNRIKDENEGCIVKIKEINQENLLFKKQISSFDRNKLEKVIFFFNFVHFVSIFKELKEKEEQMKNSKKEFEELKGKNKELEGRIVELSSNKKNGEMSVQKVKINSLNKTKNRKQALDFRRIQ